jgi:hypothetical protein
MSWKDPAQRWLREPLLHFALIGLAIFLAYGWRNPVDADSRTITITAAQVDALAAEWAQGWNRAPTPAEIDMLIREDIKDEIYTREAERLGLLRGDTVVRKRMRGRMEFIATSQADAIDPTDAQLQALLDKDAARYRLPPLLSFDQVYLGGIRTDAAAVLAQLRGRGIAGGAVVGAGRIGAGLACRAVAQIGIGCDADIGTGAPARRKRLARRKPPQCRGGGVSDAARRLHHPDRKAAGVGVYPLALCGARG